MSLRNPVVPMGVLSLLGVAAPAFSQKVRVYVSSADSDRIAVKPAARFKIVGEETACDFHHDARVGPVVAAAVPTTPEGSDKVRICFCH